MLYFFSKNCWHTYKNYKLETNQSHAQNIPHVCSHIHTLSTVSIGINSFASLQLFLILSHSFWISSSHAPLFPTMDWVLAIPLASYILGLSLFWQSNMTVSLRIPLLLVNAFFVGSDIILNFLIPLSLIFFSSFCPCSLRDFLFSFSSFDGSSLDLKWKHCSENNNPIQVMIFDSYRTH